MFDLIKGAKIENYNELKEAYRLQRKNHIEAVVETHHIMTLIEQFIRRLENETFFIFIEVPTLLDDEEKYDDGYSHKDVYFMKRLSADEVSGIFYLFEDILLNDGLSSFGVAFDYGQIGKSKCNMVDVYNRDVANFRDLFEDNDIHEDDQMITPYQLMNENHQGSCFLYEDNDGKCIYDVVESLKGFGLYKFTTQKDV
ncbi:MAG: hypothetical protein LUH02_05490 [Erysipelotrichaceae bacterium]|nr:hypothetical protein [Erysipelotrichaceae bacterium]